MLDGSKIKPNLEVISSDGQRVGTVDHMEGLNKIKLTKNDPMSHGHHHLIPLDWVQSVDQDQVRLSKSSKDVMSSWEHVA